jgi:hypothetical protein
MTGWLGDKMNTMSTNTFIEETEDDVNVQGAMDYVLAWERQLTTVSKQSSQIVKSCQDKSKALFEFGQAFSSLGLNETNEELGSVLSKVLIILRSVFSVLPLIFPLYIVSGWCSCCKAFFHSGRSSCC